MFIKKTIAVYSPMCPRNSVTMGICQLLYYQKFPLCNRLQSQSKISFLPNNIYAMFVLVAWYIWLILLNSVNG